MRYTAKICCLFLSFALLSGMSVFAEGISVSETPAALTETDLAVPGSGCGYLPVELPDISSSALDEIQLFSANAGLPEKYDLRTADPPRLTEIKDQGTFNNCWAYAANASIESNMLANGWTPDELPDFSEDYMQYACNQRDGDPNTFENADMGNFVLASAYFFRGDGPVLENDFDNSRENYPFYISGSPVNKTNSPFFKPNTAAAVQNMAVIPDVDDTAATAAEKREHDNTIKQNILKYGAVSSSYYANHISQYYNSRNYAYYYNGTQSPNHAIAIIGWDDTYPKENFTIPPSEDGAWIVRNSWGEDWGEGGYFYVSYEDTKIGTNAVSYYGVRETGYHNSYTYAPKGFSTSSAKTGSDTLYSAVRFPSSERGEVLSAISLQTIQPNIACAVSVRVLENMDSPPSSDHFQPVSVKQYDTEGTVSSVTFSQPGYYTLELETPLALDGSAFEIMIMMHNPAGEVKIPIQRYDSDVNAGLGYIGEQSSAFTDVSTVNAALCITAQTDSPYLKDEILLYTDTLTPWTGNLIAACYQNGRLMPNQVSRWENVCDTASRQIFSLTLPPDADRVQAHLWDDAQAPLAAVYYQQKNE